MKKLETNQFSDEDFPLNQSIDTAVMDRRWASGASCSSESHVAMQKKLPELVRRRRSTTRWVQPALSWLMSFLNETPINPYKIPINPYKIPINPYKIPINPYKIPINLYKIPAQKVSRFFSLEKSWKWGVVQQMCDYQRVPKKVCHIHTWWLAPLSK